MSRPPKSASHSTALVASRWYPCLLLALLLLLGVGKATGQAPLPAPVATSSAPAITASRLQPVMASSRGLRVLLSSDEATGIYFDRDTVETQTDIVLSLRVYNDHPKPRRVALAYSIVDATGKVRMQKSPSFQVSARGLVHRRELFSAPARGAFVLRVEAVAKRDGPDDRVKAELPFAVVVAPSAGYRPQSFFALDAPLDLSASELNLYKRIGARALRSPWRPPGDPAYNETIIDSQMRERLAREIATIGVLPASSGSDQSAWASQAVPLLLRYRAVRTWEIQGLPSQHNLASLDRATAQLRPSPVLIGSLPQNYTPSPVQRLQGFDGLTVPLNERLPDGREEHPAALLRLLMARQKALQPLGTNSFFVRRNGENATTEVAGDAVQSASALVTQHMLAVMSGATGMSAGLDPNAGPGETPVLNGVSLARAAAFAAMNRTLEDTAYRSDLFPRSPELWGALFRGPTSSVAVVWTARDNQGRLTLRLVPDKRRRSTPVRVLDVFGNAIATGKSGTTHIPLSSQPVYVLAAIEPEVLARALRSSRLEGLRPLAAQVLPIGFRPGAPGNKAPLQVRVQNTSLQPISGVLQLAPPDGWTLGRDVQQFKLAPGEIRIYDFAVTGTRPVGDGNYPIAVTARVDGDRWQWKQMVRVAVCDNVTRGAPVRVDGDLSEWKDAAWMEMKSGAVTGRLAVRWDARRLYFAAHVVEPSLQPRRIEEPYYHFWDGYDAIQIGFGLRDLAWSEPARGPFRDTDYGFLLSPFQPGDGGGRLLRLWSPTTPFGNAPDQVRWGGAIPGSSCTVRRIETEKTTIYEASMPLTEMPNLQPLIRARRATKTDSPVRFGWLLHDNAEPVMQWSRATSVFPWWSNTGSFLPAQSTHFAVQSTLGFTSNGNVDEGLTPQPRPNATRIPFVPRPTPTPQEPMIDWSTAPLPPLPAAQPTPTWVPSPQPTAVPQPTPTPQPRPTATPRPRRTPRPAPPTLAPMPPGELPPAAPPPDGTLPPSLPPQ